MSDDAAAVEDEASETDAVADEPAADDSEAIEDVSTDELLDRLTDSDETLTEPATELRSRIEALEDEVAEKNNEIDELTEKLSRARADFKNYKKRTKQQQAEMKARATEELVERLTDVRDNLVRALDQDDDADIRPGVESTLESFDRALEDENVAFISPAAGDEVDPERHEVMQRVDSDQPAGTIVDIYQEGYEMADKVLQPARVTVSADG